MILKKKSNKVTYKVMMKLEDEVKCGNNFFFKLQINKLFVTLIKNT